MWRKGMVAVVLAIAAALSGGCGLVLERTGETSGQAIDVREIVKAYPELSGREPEEATVSRIVDGDTFETDKGQKVRLVGVNTPETHGKAEAYGREAGSYTAKQLEGRTVIMFRDVSDTDRYGRLLRFVFRAGETEMFNERLLLEGYARILTYPPDVTMADRFLRSERKARQQAKGLWDADGGETGTKPPLSSPCEKPTVKGNINGKGDKIYHMPGDPQYETTKPEIWFCSADEAKAAGFRKPK